MGFEFNSREDRAQQNGSDPHGNRSSVSRLPESLKQEALFIHGALEHVKVPEIPEDQRNSSDLQRIQRMNDKFGRRGPGEKVLKSQAQERREMLEARADIDSLPWEVRVRKENHQTPEELVQDARDRVDMFIQDPIEREQFWYLHWNDREYTMQPDRLIWPQGFTDFFDRYDENGRRRSLPNAQKWADSSWKMLVDTNHRQRLYLASQGERKTMIHMLRPREELRKEFSEYFDDQMVVARAHLDGIVDTDPDQIYHAAAGSADPLDVKTTKKRISEYLALSQRKAVTAGNSTEPIEVDPVTGLPKANLGRLPSGLTVEQGYATTLKATALDDRMQGMAEDRWINGHNDSAEVYKKEHFKASRAHGNQPVLSAVPKEEARRILTAQARLDRGETLDGPAVPINEKTMLGITLDFKGERPRIATPNPPLPPEIAQKYLKDAPPSLQQGEQQLLQPGEEKLEGAHSATAEKNDSDAAATAQGGSALAADAFSMLEQVAQSTVASPAASSSGAPTYSADLSRMSPAEVLAALERKEAAAEGFAAAENAGSVPSVVRDSESPTGVTRSELDDVSPRDIQATIDAFPEWYVEQAIDVKPVIRSYNMLRDPLEQQPPAADAFDSSKRESRIDTRDDRAHHGISAFDEVSAFRKRHTAELERDYKPLPLFREVVKDSLQGGQLMVAGPERREVERQMKLEAAMNAYDQDLMLPDLPWDADPISDPYRGLAVDALSFNKADAEKAYMAYKDAMVQAMMEAQHMADRGLDEVAIMRHFADSTERIRRGDVGERPAVDEKIEEVYRTVFEAHMKEVQQTVLRDRGRVAEADAMRSEANEVLRKGTAKGKLLGKPFMDLMSEMSAVELERAKEMPATRLGILVNDKSLKPFAKTFTSFMDGSLLEFRTAKFNSLEAVMVRKEQMVLELNRVLTRVPSAPDVSPEKRETFLHVMLQYLRSVIYFAAGSHLMGLYLKNMDGRLLGAAENEFQNADDQLIGYSSANKGVVSAPALSNPTFITYREGDFLEGENGAEAEYRGDVEKAERIFHSGTKRRWYPILDETDYMLFLHRRGRVTMSMDSSDRCIDNMNKKTHPSVHPFPERAYKFLEGAPLTQETAEHLWLRYMGDLYCEHAAFWQALGKYQKASELRERGFNHYYLALTTAEKRLPDTWCAILLTFAKYLCARVGDGSDCTEYIAEVESCVDRMYEMEKHKTHWIEPVLDVHYRIAVVMYALPAYTKMISDEAQKFIGATITDEVMMKAMKHRAETGAEPLEMKRFDDTIDAIAERRYRQRIKGWIDKEAKNSEGAALLTHAYFAIRVRPKSPAQVEEYYKMYKDVFEGIYTQSCLGEPLRGTRLLPEAVRRLSFILSPGSREQKERLLGHLKKLEEKLAKQLDAAELQRAILTLEEHLADPTGKKPIYIYNNMGLHAMADHYQGMLTNPLTTRRERPGDSTEYRRLQSEVERFRAMQDGTVTAPSQTTFASTRDPDKDTPVGLKPEKGTRSMRERIAHETMAIDEKAAAINQ